MDVHNIIKFMYSNFSYEGLTFICHDNITRVDPSMFQFSFRMTMVKVLLSQRVAMIMLLLLVC